MGLAPQRFEIHPTRARTKANDNMNMSNRTVNTVLDKDIVLKQLTIEPVMFNETQKEKEKERVERTRKQRYDPYSFLDKMAMPFNIPRKRPDEPGKDGIASTGPGDVKEVSGAQKKPMPHCKACTDFKTWMELTANPRRNMSKQEREEKQCPLDSKLLGSNTWSFLHTMAAYYPENPSMEQQSKMKQFINLLSDFYPCHKCAAHLRDDLKTTTPDTRSNITLSEWFCELHNRVNVRLGKAEFDCSRVLERWRDGWADGTCD